MKIHEYQAKELLKKYNISVPRGAVAKTAEDAFGIAERIGGSGPYVLKAQIHGGGRGLAGGIRIVANISEVRKIAYDMLGKRLITDQTGPDGKPVQAILVEEMIAGGKEIYLGITIDRQKACPVLLAGREGGIEIESALVEKQGMFIRVPIDPSIGLCPFHTKKVFYSLGIDNVYQRDISGVIAGLYRIFIEKDCSLVEINPLVCTKDEKCIALDGKLNFDDNALYRHADIEGLRDIGQEDPLEVEASRYNLNYIKLHGSVGCMVNGAGLAMATMDLIKFIGAEPANFLDVGGGATEDAIKRGFKVLLYDKDVEMIFINIFGGILRCDVLARGIVEAVKEEVVNIPVVVRMEGTNIEEGRNILGASGFSFTIAKDLEEAAMRIKETLGKPGV